MTGAPGTSPSARRLAELLDPRPTTSPPPSAAGAAVLIILRPTEAERDVEVLLIERSVRDGDPGSGQVGLPGGHVDPSDTSLRETALRESAEEVGLGPLDLSEPPRYVGTDFARAFGLSVAIFAAPLAPHGPAPRPLATDEVAGVFWLPSRALAESRRVERTSSSGPIEVDATVFDGHVLWGFTRRILQQFFGEPGVPPDPIPVPADPAAR